MSDVDVVPRARGVSRLTWLTDRRAARWHGTVQGSGFAVWVKTAQCGTCSWKLILHAKPGANTIRLSLSGSGQVSE